MVRNIFSAILGPPFAWWYQLFNDSDDSPDELTRRYFDIFGDRPPPAPKVRAITGIPSAETFMFAQNRDLPDAPMDGSPEQLPQTVLDRSPGVGELSSAAKEAPKDYAFDGNRHYGTKTLDPDVKKARMPACWREREVLLQCIWQSQCIVEEKGNLRKCVLGSECAVPARGFFSCRETIANHGDMFGPPKFQHSTMHQRMHDREARMDVLLGMKGETDKESLLPKLPT
eukprot:TRINITY_DN58109_c0_g1_i1.p2 TRINITY_DN58109_c0_g1~~TRINITY_DN58109_c0_g1_i1.p2  ORF type:complete len:228 (+),score=25.72 TRINITY_DN58109_c0_g1_i1:195-878(+)